MEPKPRTDADELLRASLMVLLSDREREVVARRFGMDRNALRPIGKRATPKAEREDPRAAEQTVDEIARDMGLRPRMVSQILAQAMRLLRGSPSFRSAGMEILGHRPNVRQIRALV